VSDTAHHDVPLTDDGFHEIQLSGKQLVFLFMATTIVAVVIFLCGVQVGRNVKGGNRLADVGESLASVVASPAATPSQPVAASGPPAAEPPAPAQEPDDDLSYAKRLQGDSAAGDKLTPASPPATVSASPRTAPPPAAAAAPKPEATTAAAPAKPGATPSTAKAAAPAPPAAQTPAAAPPKHDAAARAAAPAAGSTGRPGTWIVQLSALQDRKAAASIVQQLAGKGYPAFVLDPTPGSPAIYRVQVGGFPDRAGAEQASRRLEKEEHFKGYVRSR